MKDEPLYKCAFCKCFFLNRRDLTNHLLAMTVRPPPANAPLINQTDHTYKMEKGHKEIEYTLYQNSGDI